MHNNYGNKEAHIQAERRSQYFPPVGNELEEASNPRDLFEQNQRLASAYF
jgi:hypothetical protein